jgi:hypothetical protein
MCSNSKKSKPMSEVNVALNDTLNKYFEYCVTPNIVKLLKKNFRSQTKFKQKCLLFTMGCKQRRLGDSINGNNSE